MQFYRNQWEAGTGHFGADSWSPPVKAPLPLRTHQNLLISGDSAPDLRDLLMDCLSDVVCSQEIVFLTILVHSMASKT